MFEKNNVSSYEHQKNYDVTYIETARETVLWSPWQQCGTQLGKFLLLKITSSIAIDVITGVCLWIDSHNTYIDTYQIKNQQRRFYFERHARSLEGKDVCSDRVTLCL